MIRFNFDVDQRWKIHRRIIPKEISGETEIARRVWTTTPTTSNNTVILNTSYVDNTIDTGT
jgi:hypothetical protein